MAYQLRNPLAGNQQIADTSTTQNHPFGTIVCANDATLGEGEFIYLKGVASTVVGSWVTYNYDDGTTTLLAANAIGPVAIAMSINDAATDFGWYQISGKGSGLSDNIADNGNVYACSSAGVVDDAVVAGDRVWNAKAASADTALSNASDFEISRPFATDAT